MGTFSFQLLTLATDVTDATIIPFWNVRHQSNIFMSWLCTNSLPSAKFRAVLQLRNTRPTTWLLNCHTILQRRYETDSILKCCKEKIILRCTPTCNEYSSVCV